MYDEQQSGNNHVRRRQRSCSINWADVVSSAGSSVLQASQNISTSSDALAQAMSRALTDSLPGILATLCTHNAVPSQPAPPNSNPAVISTSSLAPLTQASLGQGTTSGNFIVPLFVSTFSTLSMPAYGFSSLPLPSGSGSPTVGVGSCQPFPPSQFDLLWSEKIL